MKIRADDVSYIIKQKPKCVNADGLFAPVTEENDEFVCPVGYEPLPSLCPFLSKNPLDDEEGDTGVDAFHGSLAWTYADSEDSANIAHGYLAKSENDVSDDWNIDLEVPCFEGQCAQDNFVPAEYQIRATAWNILYSAAICGLK